MSRIRTRIVTASVTIALAIGAGTGTALAALGTPAHQGAARTVAASGTPAVNVQGWMNAKGTRTLNGAKGAVSFSNPRAGIWCIQLAPAINPANEIMQATIDYNTSPSATGGGQGTFDMVQWDSYTRNDCPSHNVEFVTLNNDSGLKFADEGFTFTGLAK